MSEGETQPCPLKVRRESLGLRENDIAGYLGWPVNKVKDFESGKKPLTPVEEERLSIAMDSLAKKRR
jgi:DNA-binding transcriptional regulator YiaG